MSIKNFQLQVQKILGPVLQANNSIFDEIRKYINDIDAEGICDVFDKDYILIDDLDISLLKAKLKMKVTTIDIFDNDVVVLAHDHSDITINNICFRSDNDVTNYINKLKQKIKKSVKKWNS